MKTFYIYESPISKAVAVKEGWSWWAFLFPLFWLLVHRLWGMFTLFFIFHIAISVCTKLYVESYHPNNELFWPICIAVVSFWIFCIPASEGWKWRQKKLMDRGYLLAGEYEAGTAEGAFANHERAKSEKPSS